jgi:hypothetical protein
MSVLDERLMAPKQHRQLPMSFPARAADGADRALIAVAQAFPQSPPSVWKAEAWGVEAPTTGSSGTAALAAAKARGVVIGGMRDKSRELQAEARERAEALRGVFAELAGLSHRAAAKALNERGIKTAAGKSWTPVQVTPALPAPNRRGPNSPPPARASRRGV